MTALMWAANGGHFEVTKVLIDAGASIEAKNIITEKVGIIETYRKIIKRNMFTILIIVLIR